MSLSKTKAFLLTSVILISYFLTCYDVRPQELEIIKGKAIVIDGDTIRINNNKIRFAGIDAPESYYKGKEQICYKEDDKISCGKLAKNFLTQLIDNKEVTCEVKFQLDKYKRKLGECFAKNNSLSRILVRNGYAFDYPRYSNKKYVDEQEYAKNNKLGLWSMKFEFPWDFRKNN